MCFIYLNTHLLLKSSVKEQVCINTQENDLLSLWNRFLEETELQPERWFPNVQMLMAKAFRFYLKQILSIKHAFIQVEIQKHIPKSNAYMRFLYILLFRDYLILCFIITKGDY